jgi:hypothetical protein
MKSPRFAVAVSLIVSIQACGPEDARGDLNWAGTIETLDSGVMLITSPAEGVWNAGDAWRFEEVFRVGVVEGEASELFGEIVAVEMDESGRVFILDRQAREIRVFDEKGQFVRVIGGPGQGPGEFSDPVGLGWGAEGELWVVDQRASRYLAFDSAGAFLRQEPRTSSLFAPYWRGRIDADGIFWEFDWVDVDRGGRQQVMIRAADGVATAPDTVRIPQFEPDSYVLERDGQVFARRAVPFGPQLVWHLTDQNRIWWGVGDSYAVAQLTESGDTVRVVARDSDVVSVTAADVEDILSSQLYEQFEQMGGRVDRTRIPATKRAYERVLEDDRGFLWVWPSMPSEESGRSLDVFDPEGRYLGRIEAPAALSSAIIDPPPLIRGDRLVAIVRGEFDVPQVLVARIAGRD